MGQNLFRTVQERPALLTREGWFLLGYNEEWFAGTAELMCKPRLYNIFKANISSHGPAYLNS